MSRIIKEPANESMEEVSRENNDNTIYAVPNNIPFQQFIPRERENKLYQVGNIQFCCKCMKSDNKYSPVFTYTTILKLRNGSRIKTVINSYVCSIHYAEETFPEYYSKKMFTNTKTQTKYETLIEKRYFQSNRSSEFYKIIFENPMNIKNKGSSSGISSLQTLYDQIFDIDQELFLLFEKKRYVEKNKNESLSKKSEVDSAIELTIEPEMYVEMKPNVTHNVSTNYRENEMSCEKEVNNVQSIFKNLKTVNKSGFQYKGNLSTQRIVFYKDGNLKTYNILRIPQVFEHVTLGGILGKNDLLEFGKYLKDEVFTKRQRKVEFVKVKESILDKSKIEDLAKKSGIVRR